MLTDEQLKAAADAAAAAKELQAADLAAQIEYEKERDALAYSYLVDDRTLPLDKAKEQADKALAEQKPQQVKAADPAPAPTAPTPKKAASAQPAPSAS